MECVNSCGDYYEMGDYCYQNILTNAVETGINKVIKCQYKYYENIDTNGKKELICLGGNQPCPDTFTSYNYNNGQCLLGDCSSLGSDIRKKVVEREEESTQTIIRCSIDCINTEYLKTEIIGTNLIYTCVDDCSPLLKIAESGINKCISTTDCTSKGFYKDNDECVENCSSSLKKITELHENKCINTNDCKSKGLYEKGDYCVESCSPYLKIEEED
jgi:hypothetical protein